MILQMSHQQTSEQWGKNQLITVHGARRINTPPPQAISLAYSCTQITGSKFFWIKPFHKNNSNKKIKGSYTCNITLLKVKFLYSACNRLQKKLLEIKKHQPYWGKHSARSKHLTSLSPPSLCAVGAMLISQEPVPTHENAGKVSHWISLLRKKEQFH